MLPLIAEVRVSIISLAGIQDELAASQVRVGRGGLVYPSIGSLIKQLKSMRRNNNKRVSLFARQMLANTESAMIRHAGRVN